MLKFLYISKFLKCNFVNNIIFLVLELYCCECFLLAKLCNFISIFTLRFLISSLQFGFSPLVIICIVFQIFGVFSSYLLFFHRNFLFIQSCVMLFNFKLFILSVDLNRLLTIKIHFRKLSVSNKCLFICSVLSISLFSRIFSISIHIFKLNCI